MQNVIINYPSEILDEKGIEYISREVTTGNRRIDIILKDKRDRHVLVEVQAGSLDTGHIDRHIDFTEGFLEKHPNADIRVLFIANHIDVYKKSFLQKRGYEFREISPSKFMEIAQLYKVDMSDEKNKSNIEELHQPVKSDTKGNKKYFMPGGYDFPTDKVGPISTINKCYKSNYTFDECVKELQKTHHRGRPEQVSKNLIRRHEDNRKFKFPRT